MDDTSVGQLTKRGNQYSWSNKRDVGEWIYNHIEWAFGNADRFNCYYGIKAIYMLLEVCDHTPIILNTEIERKKKGRRPYRLLNVLLKPERYREAVGSTWAQDIQGYTMYNVLRKLKLLEEATRDMHKVMSSIELRLAQLKEQLKLSQESLNKNFFNPQQIKEEKTTILQLEKWDRIQEDKNIGQPGLHMVIPTPNISMLT